MGDELRLRETCAVAKAQGFPIDFGERAPVPIRPTDTDYAAFCVDLLRFAEWEQRAILRVTPRLWSPVHLRTVADYARQHGLTVTLFGPAHQSSIGIYAGQIAIGFALPAPQTSVAVAYGLDHEYGHLRDWALLERHLPAVRRILTAQSVTTHQMCAVIGAYFSLIEAGLPAPQREAFRSGMRRIFGPWDSPSYGPDRLHDMIIIVAEILRYGEEIYNERFRQVLLGPDMLHLKTGTAMRAFRPHSLLMVATMQAAGVWEKFQRLPDFEPASVQDLRSEDIAIFRMAIRAAAQYFPTVR